ncbi:hypothetical protein [Caulobacter sp. 1776]|uniref:hypothetical protein n=1 Tax=Caulobacter sp. 1776 TaxID=3156420 RepID=UPI00339345BB
MAERDAADHAASTVPGNKASRRWAWLGGVLGAGMALAIVLQLGDATDSVLTMIARLPPLVWPTLLLLYLSQPLSDFMIYRRLWNLPPTGLEALLRKNVINEVMLGYSGDAYFYVWARRATDTAIAPFAAIKDAGIVSALLGNALTLVLAAISATQLRELDVFRQVGPALWSAAIPLAISIGVLLFGRRVFSLRLTQLIYIGAVGCLRLTVWAGLTILIWRMALPDAPAGVWIVLLAIRCLVSRIPLVSNKDLVFGNLVLLLLGAQVPIAVLLAALALVTLLLHLLVIVGLSATDLIRGPRAPSGEAIGAAVAETGAAHD